LKCPAEHSKQLGGNDKPKQTHEHIINRYYPNGGKTNYLIRYRDDGTFLIDVATKEDSIRLNKY